MKQTTLFKADTSTPPYNGQFWCHIRMQFNTWADHINFYKSKNL